MRHELVHRLAHAGPHVPASLPRRGLRRAGAIANAVLHLGAFLAFVGVLLMAVAVAVTAQLIGPLAGWFAVLGAAAATPSMARRMLAHDRDWA